MINFLITFFAIHILFAQSIYAQNNFAKNLKKELNDHTLGNWIGFIGCASKSNTESYDEYMLIEFSKSKRSECVSASLDRAKQNNNSDYSCGPVENSFCLNSSDSNNELFLNMLNKSLKSKDTTYIHFIDDKKRNNVILPSPGLKKTLGPKLNKYCKGKAEVVEKTNKGIKAECITNK